MFSALENFSANFSVPSFSLHQSEKYPDILITGDVMLSRSVGAMTKKYGVNYITDGYNPFAKNRNNAFVLLNLESPFSDNDRDKHERTFYFASNPRNMEVLKWLVNERI